jgi:hypothetical protein
MKKSLLIFSFLLFLLPFFCQAHGGVSKNINNAIVFLNQSPLSPLVNEKTQLTFALTDKNFQALANLPVVLTLTDTYYGDASKDKIILVQDKKTDQNGDFTFNYTFTKENYFDAELTFIDPISGQTDTTGFLVESRQPGKFPEKTIFFELFLASIAGFTLGWLLKKILLGKKPK